MVEFIVSYVEISDCVGVVLGEQIGGTVLLAIEIMMKTIGGLWILYFAVIVLFVRKAPSVLLE